jgi:hypothetical protein
MQMVLVAFGSRASGTGAFSVAPPRIPERCKYQLSESGDPKRVGVQEKFADNQRECCSEANDELAIATSRDSRSREAPQRNEQGHYRKRE